MPFLALFTKILPETEGMTMKDTPIRAAAFTCHRDLSQEEKLSLAEVLVQTVEALYREGITTFYCGGALGFDTVAALTVLTMKTQYPALRLVLAIPCPEQSARWSESDRARYQSILARADEKVILCEHYTRFCMMLRNRYMVDHAEVLVAYMTRESGGTASTVKYAKKKGLRLINLAESESAN